MRIEVVHRALRVATLWEKFPKTQPAKLVKNYQILRMASPRGSVTIAATGRRPARGEARDAVALRDRGRERRTRRGTGGATSPPPVPRLVRRSRPRSRSATASRDRGRERRTRR